ncbi:MAG: hypothetical protein AAF721_02685 [Myxococcota bacterium]
MSELEELVDAARELDEAPPPDAERRMWAAIAAAPIAAPVAATATAAAASSGGASSGLLLKLGLGLALVGGGTTAAVVATQPGPEPTTTRVATTVVETEPEPPAPAPEPVIEPSPEVTGPPQPDPEPEKTRPRRRTPPADPGNALAAETKLLRAAKVALSEGRAKSARQRLNEHKRRFPKGELTELRMALEVSTLCALEREGQAQAAAKRFLSRFSGSPLAAKVRQGCG